jgi:ABC-type lipoprotein export system ATPase subunit
MKIIIQNFRHYRGVHEFSFEPNAITLLKGGSGEGKSTLLNAIAWCLFGGLRGNALKPLSSGQKESPSSSAAAEIAAFGAGPSATVVILTIPQSGAIIRRRAASTSDVEVEVYGYVLKGDAATGWITNYYGTRNLWMSSSFIPQGARNPLLCMTNAEKFALLYELTFGSSASSDDASASPDAFIKKATEAAAVEKTAARVATAKVAAARDALDEARASNRVVGSSRPSSVIEAECNKLASEIEVSSAFVADFGKNEAKRRSYEGIVTGARERLATAEQDLAEALALFQEVSQQTDLKALRAEKESLIRKITEREIAVKAWNRACAERGKAVASIQDGERVLASLRKELSGYPQSSTLRRVKETFERVRSDVGEEFPDAASVTSTRKAIDFAISPCKKLCGRNASAIAAAITASCKGATTWLHIKNSLVKMCETIAFSHSLLDQSGEESDVPITDFIDIASADRTSVLKLEGELRECLALDAAISERVVIKSASRVSLLYKIRSREVSAHEIRTFVKSAKSAAASIPLTRLEKSVIDAITGVDAKSFCSALEKSLHGADSFLQNNERISPSLFAVGVSKSLRGEELSVTESDINIINSSLGDAPRVDSPEFKKFFDKVLKCESQIVETEQTISLARSKAIASEPEIPNDDFDERLQKVTEMLAVAEEADKEMTAKGARVTACRSIVEQLRGQLAEFERTLASIPAPKAGVSPDSLAKKADGIKLAKEKLASLTKELASAKAYETIKRYEEKVAAAELAESTAARRAAAAADAVRLIGDVALLSISDMVEKIAQTTNLVLLDLFESSPMSITLSLKQRAGVTASAGNAVSLAIYYKGSVYDGPSLLSGGETDRLSIALTIAMALSTRSNIVLLDECMASLDEGLREKCFETLRRFLEKKTIVNVCHSIVEGHHDAALSI